MSKEFEDLMSEPDPKDYVLLFGEHQGNALENIPLKYLDWLIGQNWLRDDTRKIIEEYLNDPVIQRELESELENN